MNDVNKKYPLLELVCIDGDYKISGTLRYIASYDNHETIDDSFNIQIHIPDDYPDNIPRVYETEKTNGYHHRFTNGMLCLSSPLEQYYEFCKCKNLLNFIDKLIIPYFYFFSFYIKHNQKPYDDLDHGEKGLRETYKNRFGTSSVQSLYNIIKYCIKVKKVDYNKKCPCGSGRKVIKCFDHKNILSMIIQIPNSVLLAELKAIDSSRNQCNDVLKTKKT